MNKLLLSIFLGFVLAFPAATQTAFAGEGPSGGGPPPVYSDMHLTVDPARTSGNGDFAVYYGAPFMVTFDSSWSCANGDVPNSVTLNAGPFMDPWDDFGGEAANFFLPTATALETGGMLMQDLDQVTPPNGHIWKTTVDELRPAHGAGPFEIVVVCPNGESAMPPDTDYSIFVDPSGVVLDACTGEPVDNAQILLEVDRKMGAGFESVLFPEFFDLPPPDGDGLISPNDGGEQITFNDGVYGWDVAPEGFDWRVTVTSALGYQTPQTLGPFTINDIDDAVTDANFMLQPIGEFCGVGGTILPVDSTFLVLAGIQSNAMWILPIAFAGAGFAAFKLRKYWN